MEDAVEYRIFPILPDGLKQTECMQYLEEQADIYLAHLSRALVKYIWQNEPFRLRVVSASEKCGVHLYGRTNYGDNVEDEWFIVYLLFELAKSFTGLVAKVEDGDGEFLLVEAANSLPRWLKPETAENRVFIYGGELHIIPQPKTPAEITVLPSGVPKLDTAVQCVREEAGMTLANSKIQTDIQRRVTGFPEKMHEFFHRAHCYIPAHLAAILEQSPHLLAPIVRAFYHRDPVDLRACVIFQHFRPGTRVLREVKFTKCLYAQLVQQKFQPDRRSGYTLPPVNNPTHKAHSIGMKLAHGAEILCSKCGSSSEADNLEQRSRNDARWHRFIDSLTEKGYFRGELEGSKLYQKLMDESRTYFYGTVTANDSDSVGERILALLKNISVDIEAMKSEEKKLQPPDDDSWLDLSPEQLDDMLRKMSGQQPGQRASFNSSLMAEAVSKFVEKKSSFEGAEFPSQTPESDIQLDPGSFMQNMQKMFEFSDSGSSSSDMSEYESDGEMEDSLSPSSPHKRLTDLADTPLQLQEYMDLMDHQLAHTTIGQSFVKQPPVTAATATDKSAPKPPPRRKKLAKKAAAAAAKQTSDTTHTTKAPRAEDIEDIDDIDDDFEPVNIDLNVVQNLLESYNSQQGTAGPASNILGSMGVTLPTPDDDL